MEGIVPIFFLAFVLKIPVLFGMWVIWWAMRPAPMTDDATGGDDHGFRRWRREPRGPRGPRRGPHGGGHASVPDCPPGGRVRGTRRSATPQPVPASRR